ncbi:hypothetical protein [Streptomyces cyaneofuscatus]
MVPPRGIPRNPSTVSREPVHHRDVGHDRPAVQMRHQEVLQLLLRLQT